METPQLQQPILEESTEIIQYVGLHELDDAERAQLGKLTAEYQSKVKRITQDNTSITIHIKKMRKNGKEKKQHKYSITIKAISPASRFRASENDWNLNTAIHGAFLKLEKEAEKVYKKNDLHKNHVKFNMKKKVKKKK